MRHYIAGNTFPVKDQIRALGCRWDAKARTWYADDAEVAERAQAIVPARELSVTV